MRRLVFAATMGWTLVGVGTGQNALAQGSVFGDSVFSTKPAASDQENQPIGPVEPETQGQKRLAAEELDSLLLGAWALVTTADQPMTDQLIELAARKCVTPLAVRSLDIERGAARQLPDPKDLFGNIVYYRTSAGLQRFSDKNGRLILLSQLVRTEPKPATVVWGVRGRVTGYRIRFSNPDKVRRTRLMLEEGGLYLKCRMDTPARSTDN